MMQSGKVKPVIDRTYKVERSCPKRSAIWKKATPEEKS